jgi:hypothetical protein
MPASGFGGGFGGAMMPMSPPPPSEQTVKAEVSVTVNFEGGAPTNPQQLADMDSHIEQACQRAIQKTFDSLGHAN